MLLFSYEKNNSSSNFDMSLFSFHLDNQLNNNHLKHYLQNGFQTNHWNPFLSIFEIPYWGILVSIEERGYYPFVEFLIRKGTHFVYFGIIALAIYAALPKFTFRTLAAGVLTMVFAIVDEYHQSLTSGRTATAQDVMLDTAGAITALLLLTCVQFIKHRKTTKV